MRKLLLILLIVTASITANAQRSTGSYSYKTALGVKVWDGGGISLKHFFNAKNAGELIAYFHRRGFRLTGLYEIHGPISGAPGLKWYIGPGAHIGFYDHPHDDDHHDGHENQHHDRVIDQFLAGGCYDFLQFADDLADGSGPGRRNGVRRATQ